MDAASQVPPGYGQLGTRAAARQSGSRRDLDWRYSSRIAGKPATEGAESRAGPGGRGETWPGNRAYSDGSDPDFKNTTLLAFLKQNVMAGSTVYTDGLKTFAGLQEACFEHVTRTQPLRIELPKGAKSVLPLADRAIGNLQQWLIGTYHGVSRDQLQVYLDEFVFRHNRRRQPMAAFQTLLGLRTGRKPTSLTAIPGGVKLSRPSNKGLPLYIGSPETTD